MSGTYTDYINCWIDKRKLRKERRGNMSGKFSIPTAKPIIIDKLDGEAILLLVYKEKQLMIDARWSLTTVERLADKGLLTGLMKTVHDLQTQLLDIKLAAEDRIRKELQENQQDKTIVL